MLTPAPLPTWSILIRALLRRQFEDSNLAAPWRRSGEVAGWLSRSAWSLALIALWRRSRAPASPLTVWLPDFFCNASLAALRLTGAKLVFYPLTEEMAPDINACENMKAAGVPDLFVVVHFFGRASRVAAARDFCKRSGSWLIEDAAHVLQPMDDVGDHGDFVLYSPHKHLPVPDGAVLVVRTCGPQQLGADGVDSLGSTRSWPDQLRGLHQELGRSAGSSRARAAIWLIKRVLQKFGVRYWRRRVTPFAEPVVPNLPDASDLGSPAPSRLGQSLLSGLICGIEAISLQRRHNQRLWDALLLHDDGSHPSVVSSAERPTNQQWTPYLAAYCVDPDAAEAINARWQRLGLPVATWPDLPTEVTMHRERHAAAWKLRHSRLYLSTHQTLQIPERKLLFT
jgi:hypothetical protein